MLLASTQQHEVAAQLARCDRLRSASAHAGSCLARVAVEAAKADPAVAAYFYEARPHAGVRFHLPACCCRHRLKWNGRRDIAWRRNASLGGHCFWSNMPFTKFIEVLVLARALRVTHVVESGRMGGLQLLHYHHFGLRVTSIELHPIGEVLHQLEEALPTAELHTGDGAKLFPEAVDRILRAEPAARVLSVIDGPKGKAALDLALRVSNQSALVVVDDIDMTLISPEHSKWFFEAWPYASTNTRHPLWRAAFPMSRDRAAVREGGGHWAWDASYYFAEKDSAIIMLGGVRD